MVSGLLECFIATAVAVSVAVAVVVAAAAACVLDGLYG